MTMPNPNKPFLAVLDLTAEDAYQAIPSALQEYEGSRLHDAADEDESARFNADHSEAVRRAVRHAEVARRDVAAARSLYVDIERQLDES